MARARAGRHTAGARLGVAWLLGVVALAACSAVPPRRPPEALTAEEALDLGLAYYERGEYAAAARAFGRALERRPGWPRALTNLGDARLAAGDVEGAIAAYQQARAAAPDDPAVLNNLAWALLQHPRRWPEAEPLVQAALAQAPQPRAYYLDTLGVLRLRQGRLPEALASFRAALGDPGLRDAGLRALILRHAGEALERLGDATGAARCRQAAEAVTASRPPAAAGQVPAGQPTKVGEADTVC